MLLLYEHLVQLRVQSFIVNRFANHYLSVNALLILIVILF